MYCFIPSWYSPEEKWHTKAIPWYRQGTHMEFDDTINQIKTFQNAGEQVKILLLGSMPELRNFLHREKIRHADIWSVFDVIQGVHGQNAGLFSYRDIHWPNDLEWVYTPFLAVAFRNGRMYARVEFGEGGHMIFIDLFHKGNRDRRFYVDDRGFLSYLIYYSGDMELLREYYNRHRQWQIREDMSTGKITVNPQAKYSFAHQEYPDMDTLIGEILTEFFKNMKESDTLIIASDIRHNKLIRHLKGKQKTVLSFFEKRNFSVEMNESLKADMAGADLIVTDTEYAAKALQSCSDMDDKRILDISPYDARVSLGKSQTIKDLKILCHIGNLNMNERSLWIDSLLKYLDSHKNTVLIIGLGMEAEKNLTKRRMEEELEALISIGGYQNINVEQPDQDYAENEVKEETVKRVFVQSCKTETDIIRVLKDVRIILDTGPKPDLYMQIAGISAGVPQILRLDSQYVEHKKNGWILKGREDLEEALEFFLKGLSNWNHALVHSIRKIAQYTNGEMIGRWKTALANADDSSTFGDVNGKTDKSTTDRKCQLGKKV